MSDVLLHFEWHTPEQAYRDLIGRVWPWAKETLSGGHELSGDIGALEAALTDAQRGYYHGVVLTEIADHARPNGEQYPMKVWKEYFRDKFLGFKTVTFTNPLTGRKSRRRVRKSTEDLGVRGYATLIDQVIAFAATELGLTISQPLPPHLRGLSKRKAKPRSDRVDPETGEILEEEGAPA